MIHIDFNVPKVMISKYIFISSFLFSQSRFPLIITY